VLDRERRRKYLSDAFHAVAQPITALHCGLEVAIAKPRSAAEYRKRIGDALEIATVFRDLTIALRELVEADEIGTDAEHVDLATVFAGMHESLEKLATLHGANLKIESITAVKIHISKERLLRTLVLLGEQVLIPGGELKFATRKQDHSVEIVLAGSWQGSRDAQNHRCSVTKIRLSAVETYIATLGGKLTITPDGCVVELPIIEA
jgi:hypothetical protein